MATPPSPSSKPNPATRAATTMAESAAATESSLERLGFWRRNMRVLENAFRRHEYMILDLVLIGAFAALTVRAFDRQDQVESLQAHTDSLQKENASLKKSIWNLKQGFLREASDHKDEKLVSRLRDMFGEGSIQESKSDTSDPKPKFVV